MKDLDNDMFLGKFCTYLALKARKYQSMNCGLISLGTAHGYLSAVKGFFLDKFPAAAKLPNFEPRRSQLMNRGIYKVKAQQAREAGANLVNGKEMATDDQVSALAAICLWQGTFRCINFFSINKCLYHLVARCCEASALRKDQIKTQIRSEGNQTYHVLQFHLERHKTMTDQHPLVYPHKDNMLWDLYFGVALQIINGNTSEDYLFP